MTFTDLDTWSAATAGIVVLLVAVTGCLAIGLGAPVRRRTVLLAAAFAGGAFQLAHLAEHTAQAGYWTGHTDAPPWMTPWADVLMARLQSVAPGTPGFGLESLHLVGNAIFLAGAVAALVLLSGVARSDHIRLARAGVITQTVHVAEHVALTASVVLVGRPIGVSTLFGEIGAGPTLWTYRVWWHFAINAVATSLLAVAVVRHARAQTATPVTPTALVNRAA